MADSKGAKGNVIKMPDLNYITNPSGLGCELFERMKKNKGLLAQIDAQTGETDTYDDLLKRCIRVAIALRTRGITSNDIVCVCTHNQLNSCVPYFAGLFIGAKLCALDPSISFSDSKHLLRQVKPKIIFLVAEKEQMYKELLDEIPLNIELVVFEDEDGFGKFLIESSEEDVFVPVKAKNVFDTSVIMFSSGTTGWPKGICLNHFSLLSQAKNFILFNFNTTRSLLFASLYWISAIVYLIQTTVKGTVRIICKPFEPSDVWHFISKYEVTSIFLAPSQAIAALKKPKPLNCNISSLEAVLVGGGPISPDNLLLLKQLMPGVYILQVYGQTEIAGCSLVFTMSKIDLCLGNTRLKSCGKPIPGFWYKIVDMETEEVVGCNKIGELRLKTKFQLNGYYSIDSSDAWDSEGWLRTGDIFYYDEEQCFYFVGRVKEMMKYQSWHVAPAVLECILHEHYAVKVAVVIGVPHEEDGEHPLGVVLLSEEGKGIKADILVEYVNSRVDDRQKLRAGILFVDEVPCTPSGKIKRKLLKDRILEKFRK